MAVDRKLRAQYYRRCDPREVLDESDARYVAIDGSSTGIRGRDWVSAIATRIELSDSPVCEFLTGLPGSGVSTELRRLKIRLGDRNGANLLVVLIDAEQVLDLHSPIDVSDILIVVVAEAEQCVVETEGGNRKTNTLERFWSWLTETEVELKNVEAGAFGPKVVLDLKTRPSLRQKVRDALSSRATSFARAAGEALAELNARAKRAGYEGLAIIVDSLENLWGTTNTWQEVLESAERVFSPHQAGLRLPVPVIYTMPMSLILRTAHTAMLLPMLRLYDREGSRAPGYDAGRAIVRRRVPDEVLDLYFGADQREAHVERLLAASGGIPRDIVRLLRDCVAEPELDERVFESVLTSAGEEYRRIVLGSEFPLLARVAVERQLPVDTDSRATVERLLHNGLILPYQNGQPWYDVHPAVHRIGAVAKEIAYLKVISPRPGRTSGGGDGTSGA
jgi:hypothetical protein